MWLLLDVLTDYSTLIFKTNFDQEAVHKHAHLLLLLNILALLLIKDNFG